MRIELVDLTSSSQLKSIENIFFSTSSKKTFVSEVEKLAFKNKYLDYYLENYPDFFYVSIDEGIVIGYLCCCPNTIEDDYFINTFKYYESLSEKILLEYPAHLHINLAKECRGKGVGSKIIDMLCVDLFGHNIRGVHIFTTPDNENVSFYSRNLFCDELTVEYHENKLLFLGRKISTTDQ